MYHAANLPKELNTVKSMSSSDTESESEENTSLLLHSNKHAAPYCRNIGGCLTESFKNGDKKKIDCVGCLKVVEAHRETVRPGDIDVGIAEYVDVATDCICINNRSLTKPVSQIDLHVDNG